MTPNETIARAMGLDVIGTEDGAYGVTRTLVAVGSLRLPVDHAHVLVLLQNVHGFPSLRFGPAI